MVVFITGAAGFIGYHLSRKILEKGDSVIGLDNLNDYYDPELKKARIKELKKISKNKGYYFEFFKGDLTDRNMLDNIFKNFCPQK